MTGVWIARLPALVLAGVGVALAAWLGSVLVAPDDGSAAPWWASLIGLVPSAVLASASAVLLVNPRPLELRRWVAGAGIACLALLGAVVLFRLADSWFDTSPGPLLAVVAILVAGLVGLALTTSRVVDQALPDAPSRLFPAFFIGGAILGATLVIAVIARVGIAFLGLLSGAPASTRIPWGAVVLVVVLPIVTFAIAAIGTRLARGRTFYEQAAANRRNALLLVISLVGLAAATAEIIAAAVTFRPVPALWAAAIAAGTGLGAAAIANRIGGDVILETAGARRADPKRDEVYLNVVQEMAIAAGVPAPRAYLIEDRSANAFATGRDPAHAAIAVTRGLLERMDREQLQAVIAHELAHVRNLDTRYGLYVAVLVGLIALVTDGFLRLVVEGWKQGAFIWSSDDDVKSAVAAFATGIAVGLFLLLVAIVLRVVAPLFSLLVQAAVSREREYLADATSVELTRNPMGLERALAELADPTERGRLVAANRGTQHLWFRNPLGIDGDRRPSLFATHPSIEARIERLRALRGLDAEAVDASQRGREAAPEQEL
jgi:heat shock protein HtpX